MLRGNLSTRPFYNERLVTLAIGAIGLVALGLAAFNASELISLSKRRSQLTSAIARDAAEASRIQGETQTMQRAVDVNTLKTLAGSTREANGLIDQRAFSWTVFFGLIEKKLPIDARLVAVSPKVDKGVFKVTMIVVARTTADLAAFDDALQSDGTFYDVLPSAIQQNDDGTVSATIDSAYNPPAPPGRSGGRGRP
ncbi:MAG TPA: hypothetical protein VLT86_04605 [Vicinamibacterales bacterium]|nr:hypothetical protein [Vicinamibacterales bacterium]